MYMDKVLAALKQNWETNCKKNLDFDDTLKLTYSDMEKFYKENPIQIISKYSFQVVTKSPSFKTAQQARIAVIEFKQTVNNLFKFGLERCFDINLILDIIEMSVFVKFQFEEMENFELSNF